MKIANPRPKIWASELIFGLLLLSIFSNSHDIVSNLIGTFAIFLSLIGLGNLSYSLYLKNNKNIIIGIGAFIFSVIIYLLVFGYVDLIVKEQNIQRATNKFLIQIGFKKSRVIPLDNYIFFTPTN